MLSLGLVQQRVCGVLIVVVFVLKMRSVPKLRNKWKYLINNKN